MADWADNFDGDGDSEPSLDDLDVGGMTLDEAQETEYLWRILVWSNPGQGKTHFAYTMPEPVCIIDTEGKADGIAHKFDKEVRLWQPDTYDESTDALNEALAFLEAWEAEKGEKGTVVVDSMSVMWTFAQQKYVDKHYNKDKLADDVEFTGLEGGSSNWQEIKSYHNAHFRRQILKSDFHICWTAMRADDYSDVFEGADQPGDKPAGEKTNIYKATDVIRIKPTEAEDDSSYPSAYLQKGGLIRHRYTGLSYPTFDKHRELVRWIEERELEGDDPTDEKPPYDVEISLGLPIDEQ